MKHKHKQRPTRPEKKFSLAGHMASQKFAALVFCVSVLFGAACFMTAAAFGNLALAVTGLYTAFVGGRAWSDGQVLKFGGTLGQAGDADEEQQSGSTARTLPTHEMKDEDEVPVRDNQDQEID